MTYFCAAVLARLGRLLFGPPGGTHARRYELAAHHLPPAANPRKLATGGRTPARTRERGPAMGHPEGRELEIFPPGHEAPTVRPYLREAERHRRAYGAAAPHALGGDRDLRVATVRR